MNEMETVKKALETAFQALDVIPVSGTSVELMATARASIRAAHDLVERIEQTAAGRKDGET